jgi:hypothetical protein
MMFGNINVGENLTTDGFYNEMKSIEHLFPGWTPGAPYERYSIDFPNGYGASIIRTPFSYGGPAGLWELAVMKNGAITYDTPVTTDVCGHKTDQEIAVLLNRIRNLKE